MPLAGRASVKRLAKRLSGATDTLEGSNSILFTFDDGPHPEVTPRILSLLEKYRAKAVFFVVGARIPLAPQLLGRILEEGHALGNHSFSHPNHHVPAPLAYLADLRQCQKAVQDLTGKAPQLFRPPLGRLTAAGIFASRFLGLKTLLWSLDTGDWRLKERLGAQARALEVAQDLSTRSTRHEIVLMHDDNPCSVEVLEVLLPRIAEMGCDLTGPLDFVLS
jgi:peptidoglycan/xylan/chitin deacetylase (PgdA/CDA1 family)